MKPYFSWFAGGIVLAVMFVAAVALVKPIGVSTQFVIADAIVWDALDDNVITASKESKSGYTSSNAYLAKSGGKYAKNAANPVNYSFIFVLSMVVGAFVSSRLKGGDRPIGADKFAPKVWRDRFGESPVKRYIAVFIAGFLVLYGARLAGGCTSGHMMSGLMQTSLSGFLFTIGAFATGIPTAILLFNKKSKGDA